MASWVVGLRPRLLAALLLTAAVTLAAAALALLGPLEQRLRQDTTTSLVTAALEARPSFDDAFTNQGKPHIREIAMLSRALGRRTGTRVAMLDSATHRVFDTDFDIVDPFDDARRALAANRPVHDVRNGRLRVSTPLRISGRRFVLVLRKRLTEVTAANRVVRNVFTTAAAVGLGVALLLGLGLATTLLRRLRRLRDAARQLETAGLDAPAPVDRSRDEIGELTRTFAAMQSRLRRQEAARRTFVATASHELRTPLASLEGMLELLGDDLQNEPIDIPDARQRLSQAQEQSRRLAQLASDLLDLSRLDADIELRSEPVEVPELCRAVIAEFDLRAHEHATELELARAEGECWATGDPGSIARIARILIDNAVRLSPVGAPVRVEVQADGGWVCMSVADQGPGVPPEERDLIFERFRRGHSAEGKGFGLGLAIGRELAERMGGSLVLADSGPGARFELRLPGARVPVAVAAE